MYKESLLLLTLTAFLAVECLGESHGNSNELVERDNDKGQEEVDLAAAQIMLNNIYGHLIEPVQGLKIQQRVDKNVDFLRNWDEYVEGFGDPNTNFWLGLEKIHKLSEGGVKLRVDLWFTGEGFEDPNDIWTNQNTKNYNNEHRYAEYINFSIGSAATNYRLHVSGYHGTAGDSLIAHNGRQFSTKDHDNDGDPTRNCALEYTGGWWYNGGHTLPLCNLNGRYNEEGFWKGSQWFSFTVGQPASRVEMKIWI